MQLKHWPSKRAAGEVGTAAPVPPSGRAGRGGGQGLRGALRTAPAPAGGRLFEWIYCGKSHQAVREWSLHPIKRLILLMTVIKTAHHREVFISALHLVGFHGMFYLCSGQRRLKRRAQRDRASRRTHHSDGHVWGRARSIFFLSLLPSS